METQTKIKTKARLRKGYHYQDLFVNGIIVSSVAGTVETINSASLLNPITVLIRDRDNMQIGMFHVEKVVWI